MIDIHCNYRANCAFAWNVHFLARKRVLCREMVTLKMKHVSGFGVAAPEIGHGERRNANIKALIISPTADS